MCILTFFLFGVAEGFLSLAMPALLVLRNSQQQTNSPVLKKTVNNVLRRSNRIDLLERKRSVEETADFVNEGIF